MRFQYTGTQRVRAYDTAGQAPTEPPRVRDVGAGDEVEVEGTAYLPAGVWVSSDPPRFANGVRLPPKMN